MRDPEVEELLTWFEQCYDLEIHPMTGAAYWRRVALPGDGGIGSQDARLIFGLAYMATLQQQAIGEDAKRRAREDVAKRRSTNG